MNNNECQIQDEDTPSRFNFRRFTSEEIEKKHSPFERIKKREFPFLFQKKKFLAKEEVKISLEDIITTVGDISQNTVSLRPNQFVNNGVIYEPNTPPYPPTSNLNELMSELDLNTNENIVIDEQK